jgi:uncharacterized protein (DUF427 family)
MVQAIWNGQVVADSDGTVIIEGNHYFPQAAVRDDVLRESAARSRCPWKGIAHYYDLEIDGQVNRDAAWYYPKPNQAASNIEGHVAFWNGVEIR